MTLPTNRVHGDIVDPVDINLIAEAVNDMAAAMTRVSGVEPLPFSAPLGQLRGYRAIDTTTFTHWSGDFPDLPPGAYVFEYIQPGWMAHSLSPGVEPGPGALFLDSFTAADGTALHGRTIAGLTWVDNTAVDVYASSVNATRSVSSIVNGRIPSSSDNSIRSGQINVGKNKVRVSFNFYHDGVNPGSGNRSLRVGLSGSEYGALVTNAGTAGQVNGIYAFYEGGAGFRGFCGLNAAPSQIGADYTGHGTGLITANLAIEYDGVSAKFLVDGAVRGTRAFPGFTGTTVSWQLGRVPGWWVDDFRVDEIA